MIWNHLSTKMCSKRCASLSLFLQSLALIIALCLGDSPRIYFTSCGAYGFSCAAGGSKQRLTYTCPTANNDVTFYAWQFRSPTTIDLTITNCTTLRLGFECTGEAKVLTQIRVANITNLIIIKATFTAIPETLIFENIANLEYLPENTFSQIRSKTYKPGCSNPPIEFKNLHFDRVNIGIIAPNAFDQLKDFGNFTWTQVNVHRIQHAAAKIQFNNQQNNRFLIEKSNLEIMEHLAFSLTGRRAQLISNKFVDLSSSAINGTIESFNFDSNNVNNMQAYAVSILAQYVHIIDNRFEYLRAGALERISPGLLQDSQKNFGSLKFVYEFRRNFVNFLEAGSLNPDMQAYDNVATEIMFSKNSLLCSCENLGWLLSETGHGHSTSLLDTFYDVVLDPDYNNTCSYTTCGLSLKAAKNLIENGKCSPNATAESLCVVKSTTGRKSTTTTTSRAITVNYYNGVKNRTWQSTPDYDSSDNSDNTDNSDDNNRLFHRVHASTGNSNSHLDLFNSFLTVAIIIVACEKITYLSVF